MNTPLRSLGSFVSRVLPGNRWRLQGLAVGMILLGMLAQGLGAAEPSMGLVRTLTAGGVTDVSVTPNVWLFVPAGQPATPFVPAGPFTARWEGAISADLRGDFTFQALSQGALKVSVNGATALEAKDTGPTLAIGQSVRLNKGSNSFRVEFTSPAMGEAMVRLFWTNRETPLNTLPLAQLTHESSDALRRSTSLHQGRDLFLEFRCARCHQAPGSVPELSMDAPAFNGIGSRRNVEWMAAWIQNPQAHRPGTPMPAMVSGDTAAADAVSMAAYLGSLKGEAPPAVQPGNVETGKALFEKLHCVACHPTPGSTELKPHQISQKAVLAKFTPGALAAFLQKPEQHFRWIRMPNFKLTATEAADLAVYLGSAADPAPAVDSSKSDPARVEQGRKLVASTGCLNCHALDGVKNEATAKPLTQLAAASWTSGCLAEKAPAGSKAPRYTLTADQRAALQAFGASDRSSLDRATTADFLERQSVHLNCRECHGQFEGFPAWDHLPGKLKPEWATRFIRGEIPVKPRSWGEYRMPAFPAYAQGLGEGLSTLAGLPPVTAPDPAAPDTAALAEAGRKLAGANGGFGCVSCHSIGEFGATQVFEAPGINLATSFDRLQPDYFRRWLRAPTTIDPASKMPVYFDEEGKSPLPEILGGDGSKTIQAVWEYLRLKDKMAKPE